jgi:indolepyruvate ferredoxin oxidoreductase beta subunit
MKKDIIISGVGGQGILTISAILDTAALKAGYNIKQSEVHGMSQRGGAVQSHVRISDKPVYSDLIPFGKADMILSVEPMELLRYLPYLKPEGYLITDINPFKNISNYPEEDRLKKQIEKFQHHRIIDAKTLARKAGNMRAANIVLIGAASDLLPFEDDLIEEVIQDLFARKGERIVQMNIDAYHYGKEAVKQKT